MLPYQLNDHISICVGSLNNVINDNDLKKFKEGLECLDQGKAQMKEWLSKTVGHSMA